MHHDDKYIMLKNLFQNAGKVTAVHRVHNPALFKSFQVRGNNFKAACGNDWDDSSMVRWLFHGTTDEFIQEIITDPIFGFKALMCKQAVYGKGIYFAK